MNSTENPMPSIPSASEYILDNFQAAVRIAMLVLNRDFGETIQRLTSAEKAASPEFQAWLRYQNANGSDIYVTSKRTGWFVLPRISPAKLARSCTDAAYLRRNLRNIEALIDQQVLRNGQADSEPGWRQTPSRMV